MPSKQVFVSYSSQDRDRAIRIVEVLEQAGWSVWWDRKDIPPGARYPKVIDAAIRDAEAMIVLWSTRSVESDWVLDEAQEGKDRGILVPVLVDQVEVPRGFRQLQHAQLVEWQGGGSDAELLKLLDAVRRLAPPASEAASRPEPPLTSLGGATGGALPRPPAPRIEPPAVGRPINLGFDGAVVQGFPDGWFNSFAFVDRVSTAYECSVVRRPEVNGACLLLRRGGAHPEEFGSVMQRCAAGALAGETVRFQAELRSEDVSRWAGLWLRGDGADETNLFFDNMHRRPIRGSTPWQPHHIDAQLPVQTRWLNYGVVLAGDGQVWVDDCRLLVWDHEGRWRDW